METRFFGFLATLALTSIAGGCAANSIAESQMLTNNAGMTVYTFDQDSAGKSNCNGPCATVWPPVKPGEVTAADSTIIIRDDGTQQAAFKGKPIYLFAADQKPGDMKGDNLEQVWHAVLLGAAGKTAPRSTGYSNTSSGSYSYGY